MSFFSDAELKDLYKKFQDLANVVWDKPEENAGQQVDDALSLAQDRVSSGQWTEKKAQLHLNVVSRAAASTYASARKLKVLQTKKAFKEILNSLAGIVNGRIGFPILPID